ncbi:MAG: hypothetical protein Q7S61_02765 [bacterium]|nr:hypothetical protein [bacterium]
MDFKTVVVSWLASFLLLMQRFFLLIISPYPTMRKISMDRDTIQAILIFLCIWIYFQIADIFKKSHIHPTLVFLIFCFNFVCSIFFCYGFSRIFGQKNSIRSYMLTFSYSLLPTLVWFTVNSFLYALLPPPRQLTLMGKAFSVFFVSFSISLLVWKIILFYLALRFSTRLPFYRLVFILVLYVSIFLPYSVLLYTFKIFRVPFI